MRSLIPRRFFSALWIAVVLWTCYAVTFASQVMDMGAEQGQVVIWSEALKFSFGGWMTWIPLSLGLYCVVHRFPVQRGNLLKPLLILTMAALAVALLRGIYVYATNSIFNWYDELPDLSSVVTTSLGNNLPLAWIVIGLAHGLVFHEHSNERHQKVAELEKSLAGARLEALRAQLNPHFLFNALNSVAELVHEHPDTADEMLLAISALLRDSLAVEQPQVRGLRQEIELVENYLLIEQIRLGDRLHVKWYVEEDCLDDMVPTLTLQLLVENAIVHALSRSGSGSTLVIKACVAAGFLVLAVENGIPSIEGQGPNGTGLGLGLKSVGGRLQLLYGDMASVSRARTRGNRYRVEIRIPRQRPRVPGLYRTQ